MVREPSLKTILKWAIFAFVVAFAAKSGWEFVSWIDWEGVLFLLVIVLFRYPTATGFVTISLVMAFIIWKYRRN